MSESSSLDIAVVGLSARLPGARNYREFWDHLLAGRELVTFFPEEEVLRDFSLLHDPLYVRAAGLLPDHDRFDAELFGISPRLAAMMSPEHRQFLECAWEALEDAGYAPEGCPGEVGVYGACNQENIARYKPPPEWLSGSKLTTELANGWFPDSLTPNVLYYLGLNGEAVTVASYCAGFHYAVHLASQSLLLRQVDLALAGSVSVKVPQRRGYMHVPGGVMSRDGHTRPFDARGTGSVQSSGAVMIALRRLEDALESRDHIYAVIKGSAMNNNGARAIQYGAPQPERLAQCVAAAMATGDVAPATVSAIECYGLGHPMADTLEVDALRQVFRGARGHACALGSVKGNIGHCATASGGSSFAKALLALRHATLPATIHHDEPHPQIAFAQTPFRVQREAAAWAPACGIRRVGVTALGGAGHNAHIVLEEPPRSEPSAALAHAIVGLSARTPEALAQLRANLAAHLAGHPELALADLAFTLATGRRPLAHRWAVVVGSVAELVDRLTGADAGASVGEARGDAGPGPGGVTARSEPAAQRRLADAWARGEAADWAAYYRGVAARRVPLPTYPLARERHWLEAGHAY